MWAVIEHAEYESAGALRAALDVAGCRWLRVRRSLGEELPNICGLDGLIVLGGPGASADDDSVASLVEERTLIAGAVAADLPVLGICLGAQLLAVALGGSVLAAPAPEIGMSTVRLTEAGATDPVLGPLGSPFPVLQWHHETFSVPQGGVRLAASDTCATQAFRWADRVYGLQFHVEIDPALAERIQPELEPVRLDEEAVSEASLAGRSVLVAAHLRPAPAGHATATRRSDVTPSTARSVRVRIDHRTDLEAGRQLVARIRAPGDRAFGLHR